MHHIDLSALSREMKGPEAIRAFWLGADSGAFTWDRTSRELRTPCGEIVRIINARHRNVSLLMDVVPVLKEE